MKTKIDIQGLFEHWVNETKHPEGSYDLSKLPDSTTYVKPETRCAYRGFCAVFELFGSPVGWLIAPGGNYEFFSHKDCAVREVQTYKDFDAAHPEIADPEQTYDDPEPVFTLGQAYLSFTESSK